MLLMTLLRMLLVRVMLPVDMGILLTYIMFQTSIKIFFLFLI
jgi:hypothetical protein